MMNTRKVDISLFSIISAVQYYVYPLFSITYIRKVMQIAFTYLSLFYQNFPRLPALANFPIVWVIITMNNKL